MSELDDLRKELKHNDWDSVDDSAPYIVGPYLINRDKKILYQLAKSNRIWDRRQLYLIRQNFDVDLEATIKEKFPVE